MNINQGTDLTAFIEKHGNELLTDSRAVAIAFERRHADVLKTIERMMLSAHAEIRQHGERNFSLTSYADKQGREKPMYSMTAKGLSELAMGFTGDQSRIVRIRFLNAFEAVAARLHSAELSILELMHRHDRRSAASEAKGRIGSKLMNERKKEKPALAEVEYRLLGMAQPSLLN